MFLKMSKLKKLLKVTWQTHGLIVAHQEYDSMSGAYVVLGNCWKLWIRDNKIPKELKAAIIELSGDLPEKGEAFETSKDRDNQYEMEMTVENIPESANRCDAELQKTQILWDCHHLKRVYQKDNVIVLVPEAACQMIDLSAIDRDAGEFAPVGPMIDQKKPHDVYWANEECIFKVAREYPVEGQKAFFDYLGNTDVI